MTSANAQLPYHNLTPETILDALEHIGLKPDGRLIALNSYENRVYMVYLENGDQLVTKFYRPNRWTAAQIQEEHTFTLELAQAEIPVAAPLVIQQTTLHNYRHFFFTVYPRMGGREPELDDPFVLEWIGRFLGRIHTISKQQVFQTRPELNTHTFGETSRTWLMENHILPMELASSWLAYCNTALDTIKLIWQTLPNVPSLRLHGDCHPGNILWRPEQGDDPGGPHFVDLDDCRMGPAIQDIWMLLGREPAEQQQRLSHIMAGYEDFCAFNWEELQLIEPLRTLRIIHYSAWLARRWHDPAFQQAFPWFGTHSYWQEQIQTLSEQVQTMRQIMQKL